MWIGSGSERREVKIRLRSSAGREQKAKVFAGASIGVVVMARASALVSGTMLGAAIFTDLGSLLAWKLTKMPVKVLRGLPQMRSGLSQKVCAISCEG